MSGINKAIILGRLGKDPATRDVNGRKVCDLSLATSESWKDKSGQKQERTEWHRVVFWGKPAEIIAQYATKGSQLYVEGRIETRKYEKDGETRYATQIVGSEFRFLGGGKGQSAAPGREPTPVAQPESDLFPEGADVDEIPF